MKGNRKLEQNKKEASIAILPRSLLTGFIGGILWSAIGTFMYYFNFSEIAPRFFVLRSWTKAEWADSWLGDVISILLIGAISILTALIYYGLFRKINNMWAGVAYGVVLWAIVFYLLQPIFTNIPTVADLKSSTIISTLSLYVIYGTFIGYSISYDYEDSRLNNNGS